ncbi:hypothetical protein F4604DRAFT_1681473 [Suillus subluteus]|nr:hypothetical protein F4604DRAFT_1681473 [Suillus subluteus]
MPMWNQTHYNRNPTVDGLNEALAIIPLPKILANINGIQERWKVTVLAMLVHQLHNDGLSRPDSCQQVNQEQRLNLWQICNDHTRTILALIFDLCTTLDRLTGGSTLFFHHPGATAPGGNINPESLKADVYINPRVLAEDGELHHTIAEISQLFIERFATPLAHRFAASHILNGWPPSTGSNTTPACACATQYSRLSLIPAPFTKSSCHFHILAQLMGLNTPLLSAVPQGSPLTWNMQAVPVSSAPANPNTLNIQALNLRTHKALVVVYDSSDSDGYPDPGPITPVRIQSATPSVVKTSKQRAPQPSSSTALQSSSSVQHLMSPLQVQHHKVLVSFSPQMEEVIEGLGLSDTLHMICASIAKGPLPKQWVVKLTEQASLSMEEAEAIVEAMLLDAGFISHVSKEFRALLTHRRREKRMNEECERGKTSAWSAWVHFKGIKSNTGNSEQVRCTQMTDIMKDKAKYSELTEDEKKALITEFDEVKSRAVKRPSNITARVKSSECAKNFQAVKDELKALSQRAGVEAFIFMVRGTSDFQMAPKAFFTSAACDHFMQIYLQHDTAHTATDFESAMLSKGIFNSVATNHKDCVIEAKQMICSGLRASLCDVTKDASATMEFTRYKVAIVCKYHVKLVGWNHPQWVNPSDLKGRIEALENIVSALANNTCHFVEITAAEVDECKHKIADGAMITPETEPPLPPPPSTHISPLPSQSTLLLLSTLADSGLSSGASSAPDFSIDTPNSFDVLPDVLCTAISFDAPDVSESESRPPLLPISSITPDVSESESWPPSVHISSITPDVSESKSRPPLLPASAITDDLVNPNITDTQNAACNDGPPLTTSQRPRSKVHCKRQADTDENAAPQPHAKCARKLTEKQAVLEDAKEQSKRKNKRT